MEYGWYLIHSYKVPRRKNKLPAGRGADRAPIVVTLQGVDWHDDFIFLFFIRVITIMIMSIPSITINSMIRNVPNMYHVSRITQFLGLFGIKVLSFRAAVTVMAVLLLLTHTLSLHPPLQILHSPRGEDAAPSLSIFLPLTTFQSYPLLISSMTRSTRVTQGPRQAVTCSRQSRHPENRHTETLLGL